METNKNSRATQALEKALVTRSTGLSDCAKALRLDGERAAKVASATQAGKYVMQLYVAGATARSRRAVLHIRQLCEVEMKGKGELKVIDIYQQPHLARDHQIVATPTLIIEFPRPVRRFIGNLLNVTSLFIELELIPKVKIAPAL